MGSWLAFIARQRGSYGERRSMVNIAGYLYQLPSEPNGSLNGPNLRTPWFTSGGDPLHVCSQDHVSRGCPYRMTGYSYQEKVSMKRQS